jgi:hypothetical protein
MEAAIDRSPMADSAARGYSDLETVRRRLIELEKNRIFSDEDLALLLRKSVYTNLKADFDYRSYNRRLRRSASRTTSSGRAVIRSWSPAVVDPIDPNGSNDGWKQFEPVTASRQQVAPLPSLNKSRGIKRPTRLKNMQSRNFIVTFLANLVFIPKQACCTLLSFVVPSSRSASRTRAC